MNKRLSIALLLTSACLLPSLASARTDNSGVYAAASQYRQAVVEFEQIVVRVRGIERTDERVVDKFEEATKRMLAAARNPRHLNRLRFELGKVIPLQSQVERAIFGKYTPNHGLATAWDRVLYTESVFLNEMVYQLENPNHSNAVQRRTSSTQLRRFFSAPSSNTRP